MNRTKVLSIAFAAAIGGMAVINLAWPQKDFSENENRVLQTLPSLSAESLFSGKFAEQFESFTTDQFPLRDGWVGLKTMTQLALLKKDNGRIYFGRDGYLIEQHETADVAQLETNIEALATFLAGVRRAHPAVRSSVMIAPTAAAILPEKLPALAPAFDQQPWLTRIGTACKPYAVVCDPTAALLDRKDQDLYYRTDHHWTTYGAYAAYTAWAQAVGLTPLDESAFTVKRVTDRFFGTTYSKANLYTARPDAIDVFLPREVNACTVSSDGGKTVRDTLYMDAFLDQKDKYAYFLGGNHAIQEITTGVHNSRTLLLIKDSYAHCFVPFLAQHYERIEMVDLRYYKGSLPELMADKDVTDLLVLYNLITFMSDKSVGVVADSRF